MRLCVENLKKSFNQNMILNGISFSLPEGSLLVATGSNGAGKSTLVKCLGRCLDWDEGKYSINDEEFSLKTHSKKLSVFLGEEGSYLPYLTFHENLEFYSSLRGLNNFATRIHRVKEFLPIEKFFHKRLQTLSRGEQQLFFLSRSLSENAEVYIMDEPITHLDDEKIVSVFRFFEDLLFKQKRIIVVTAQNSQLSFLKTLQTQLLHLSKK